jgi:pimeloyl-ACP methyl ester carboxylesterase
MKQKHIIYIHGAGSSSVSFNFLKAQFPEHTHDFLEYDDRCPLDSIIDQLYEKLPDDREFFLVAHSLGGVIATALTYKNNVNNDKKKIKAVVSISAPFGGTKIANYLKWFYPGYGLFDNVATINPVIQSIQTVGAIVPTLCVVTNGGSLPLIGGASDGVVSVKSQTSLENAIKVVLTLNHFEVLLSYDTASIIGGYIWTEEVV